MRARRLLPVLALASPLVVLGVACAPAGSDVAGGDEDTGRGEHRLDVRPGDRVTVRGVSVLAPQPDAGVWAEVIRDDGSTETLHLRTDGRGAVFLVDDAVDEAELAEDAAEEDAAAEEAADAAEADDAEDGEAPAEDATTGDDAIPGDEEVSTEEAGEATAAGSAGPCKDRARNGLPFAWTEPYRWKLHAASVPSSMSKDVVERKLRRAANNITSSRNSCGLADQVSAQNVYLGRTTKKTNVRADGTCTQTDGMNTVGFGDLPAGVLGVACTWYSNGVALESDVRFNKVDHRWYAARPSSCSGRYSVEAVATHEFGHVFGLGHVGEGAHGNLTMSPSINGSCQNAEATLGRGDVIGLRAKY